MPLLGMSLAQEATPPEFAPYKRGAPPAVVCRGRGGALARHAGRVVRTVRRLRKSKGPKRRGGSRQAGALV